MGKIVNVLGLGPSLDLYVPNGNISIGVNDIWSRVKTDYVVCVDMPNMFTPERWKVIESCKPIKFYSQIVKDSSGHEIKEYKDRPDFEHIELLPYFPNYECQLDTKQLPKSHCSPFVAAVIAFKFFYATEIHLYGVDIINHPHLDQKQCEKIKVHFRNLKIALRQKGCEMIIHGNGILKNL